MTKQEAARSCPQGADSPGRHTVDEILSYLIQSWTNTTASPKAKAPWRKAGQTGEK